MFGRKLDADTQVIDRRLGVRGSLCARLPPLGGADPYFALQDPPRASPALASPPGQVTHS